MEDCNRPSLAVAYGMKRKKKMAQGGFVRDEEASGYGSLPREDEKMNYLAMREDHRMLNQHGEEEVGSRGMEDDNEMHMERGYEHPVENQSDSEDMVGEIMRLRSKHYSLGGRVANDTPITADFEDNDFDDLVGRDDLDSSYTGENSGDELGNARTEEDDKDMIDEIMASRRKRDRMPRPA